MKQLERFYLPAVALLVVVILAGAGLLVYRSSGTNPGIEIALGTPSSSPLPIHISVTGAVVHPGVYALPAGSTLDDALKAAGGAAADADPAYVNLSSRARDGDRLHVPSSNEVPQKVNINTADAWLLEALPGIGSELAARIVDYRSQNGPFTRIEDLTQVKGITQSVFEKLKDKVAVN